ncbi:trehalose-6-phosphate synthase, partial [Candidatus Woesearchaeota archaeon]|nr:trehalose-6-phosphate synthase [Candidatus Woesearchaeota archaeon]
TEENCDRLCEFLEKIGYRINISDGGLYTAGKSNKICTIKSLPIGVNSKLIGNILDDERYKKRLKCMIDGRDLFEMIREDKEKGTLIVGGLERGDYTKGLLERLEIYACLRKKLSDSRFYQITSPTREECPSYKEFHNRLESKTEKYLAADLNSIVHTNKGIGYGLNFWFMKDTDIMLVTPLADGMNLVALEYIISQKHNKEDKRGILAIGNCGAADTLRKAGFTEKDGIVYIDPYNPEEAAEAIYQAKTKNHSISDRLIHYVENYLDINSWVKANIEGIREAGKASPPKSYVPRRISPKGSSPSLVA